MSIFEQRFSALQQGDRYQLLRGIRRGIEKESLRVTPDGSLAQTAHPAALGSALKHPNITTDFSEALLEFITPACNTMEEALAWLQRIHVYTNSVLQQQNEKIWPASMPCVLGGDNSIPLAKYGSTHTARMKTAYREGLGHRYGRSMQAIAGIHYNVSFSDAFWVFLQQQEGNNGALQDFKTRRYFDLIRNFRRHLWLLLYLFGASPALCASFVQERQHHLASFDGSGNSLHLPFATSLRMGGLGYQSDAQAALMVCYNGLPSYIQTLKKGLITPYAPYEKIGVRDADGHYRQLSTSLLQIENEFYSTIRPKRVVRSGETPIRALHERGVEYIEVRCLDLDPYLPLGMDVSTAAFIEVFLLWCLLSDSPLTDEEEYVQLARNQAAVVERGRDPSLLLEVGGEQRSVLQWALQMQDEISQSAQLLDHAYETTHYSNSVDLQYQKLRDNQLTTSARVLQDMRASEKSFFQLTGELAQQHANYFSTQTLSEEQQNYFVDMAQASSQQQSAAEAEPVAQSFEDYLAAYYAQYDGV
ncbi:MAG: glutamate--cysteine ligase [Cellvibrionales bacterium]|nr:glutamate--cysteine ligase [Cellvibrionales bacterium]